MTSSSCTNSFLSRMTTIDKAAEVAKKAPPRVVELSEEAKTLPPHIRSVTDPAKLNAQTPFFKCPPWAALPALACHLHCSRDGVPLPSLGLDRFPFYLFGRSSVCDYVLQHPSISSIHAVLVFHGEQQCFVLMDLGSTNGVKLNGTRIVKKRPVPAPVGSCIQFGFSGRLYNIRLGPSPSSKRLREEQEMRTHLENNNTVEDFTTTITATTSNDHKNEVKTFTAGDEGNIQKTGDAKNTHPPSPAPIPAAVVAMSTVPEHISPVSVPLPSREERHLYHVLIKHKDVRRPISLAPRNKGDKITRSKTDAVALAQAILAHHGNQKSRWSLEDFITVVRDYSECGSAKRNGDLGIVERGTYTETFDMAAFALDSCMVSAPVETELGVHLIYFAD